MKKMIRSAISAAAGCGLVLFSTIPSFGQDSRFYVRGAIGGALTDDTTLKEFPGIGAVTGVKVKFDPGVQLRAAGGYRITDWLATEVESGMTYNSIKSITGATEADGSLANVPFLANLVLQAPEKSWVVPYIGGGVGGASSVLYANDLVLNGVRLTGTQAAAVFAYQGFAGIRFHINPRMSVGAGYTYFATGEPSWKTDFGSGPDKLRFGENRTHAITASFTYDF